MITVTISQKIKPQPVGHIATMSEDEQMAYYREYLRGVNYTYKCVLAIKEELDSLSEGLHLTDIDIAFMNEHKNYCKYIWSKYESN